MTPEELSAAGFDVDAAAHGRLTQFVRLLLVENQRLNLTAARSEGQLWRAHVCDALALLRVLPAGPARLLDLGTGGGLPGLPLACVRDDLAVTLLDATRKKVAALDRIIAALALPDVHALAGRAETLAHDPAYREQFDLVTARAVATLPALLEYAAGFVRPDGQAWFYKSARAAKVETAEAVAAARTCCLTSVDVVRYRLPGESAQRLLVGYRKLHPLPAHLPRPPGRAKKRPL